MAASDEGESGDRGARVPEDELYDRTSDTVTVDEIERPTGTGGLHRGTTVPRAAAAPGAPRAESHRQ